MKGAGLRVLLSLLVIAALGPPQVAAGQPAPAAQQTQFACEGLREPVCNPDPAARATFVASDPLARPSSAHPTYLTRDQAIREARGSAPANSVIHAAFMKYADYGQLPGAELGSAVHQPDRMVWVVTVHADVRTPGDLVHKPQLMHVYTVVIDAETGIVTDACIGCALISSDTPGPAVKRSRISAHGPHPHTRRF